MNPANELKVVIGQLRHLLLANWEMGLDPPALTPQSMEYLERTPTGQAPPLSLDHVKGLIWDCRRCKLWHERTNLVFGEGSSQAQLVFVGDGPGDEEDRAGRPIMGAAGNLLTRIIENGMGLSRDDVYICNVIKCKLPDIRDPERDEIEACMPFLRQQLRIIEPEVICVLGQIAGQALLGKSFQITQERGRWHSFMDIPVMPTFHPAYILGNPSKERTLKSRVWQDVKAIMIRLGLEVKRDG